MWENRICYTLLALLSVGLWLLLGTPLSGLCVLFVVSLPFFSLLLSLPAILRFTLMPKTESVFRIGQRISILLEGSSPLPMPPFSGGVRLIHIPTGSHVAYQPTRFRVRHCGCYEVRLLHGRVHDYLGLFSLPVRSACIRFTVLPEPVSVDNPPLRSQAPVIRSRPMPGGGFSERSELRPFLPGDSLRRIHWKLSVKTGSLLVRRPTLPVLIVLQVQAVLRGTPEELDRLYGRILWLGTYLLEQQIPFQLTVLTKDALITEPVADESALQALLNQILSSHCAEDSAQLFGAPTGWVFRVGGDPIENSSD